MAGRIFAWDLPVRLFHWALTALVVFSYVAGKIGGGWMEWHLKSGYAILALLLFRLAWGVAGSATARFSDFVRGPRAAIGHARDLCAGRRPFIVGHNPLGGWMVLLLLAILLVQAVTGLFADDEIATQGPLAVKVSSALVARMSAIHAYNSWVIVGVVAVHVAAVLFYQWYLKIDLMRPMISGWKALHPGMRAVDPKRASTARAVVLLAIAASLVYVLVVVYPHGAPG